MEWLVERSRGDLSTIRSYSQSALIALPADVSGPALERALQTILDRHDVLRARLDAATHQLEIREPGSITAPDILRRTSIVSTSGEEFVAAAETAMQDASGRLDPEHGKMISAVWLDPVSSNGNRAEAGRLLLVLHHLAVDGVSWRMLVPGLVTAYASAFDGETPILPPGGTSIRRWRQRSPRPLRCDATRSTCGRECGPTSHCSGHAGSTQPSMSEPPSTESASTFRPP
ncbi:condensation domain-containing protein [Rhodococcus sp. 3Y1]